VHQAAAALALAFLGLITGCFYTSATSATINLRDFQARGLSMARFNKTDTTVER